MAKGPDVRIGVVQPEVIPGDVEANLDRLSERLSELKKQGVRLAVLPEFFPTGNTLAPELLKTAIKHSKTVGEWLSAKSSDLEMMIAGSYLRLEKGDVYTKGSYKVILYNSFRHEKAPGSLPGLKQRDYHPSSS